MNIFLTALAFVSIFVSPQQEPSSTMVTAQPKELKALDFLKGEWDADLVMFMPGSTKPTPLKGTINCADALNGMWIQSQHESDMGGMPVKALQMTCYDPEKKQYMAYWFDSAGPGGLELWGTLKGQTLSLESKPIAIPGMPGKHAFRSTHSLKGPGKVFYRMEMNSGKGWSKMIEGTLTKK